MSIHESIRETILESPYLGLCALCIAIGREFTDGPDGVRMAIVMVEGTAFCGEHIADAPISSAMARARLKALAGKADRDVAQLSIPDVLSHTDEVRGYGDVTIRGSAEDLRDRLGIEPGEHFPGPGYPKDRP